MQLNALDWLIVVLSIVVSFIPVIFYYRRAASSTTEFFGSGRAAPWWLIGTSMVATTFSTDTPNLVADFVRTGGVSKNWLWWAFLLTGMTTVFFYARLWRRSGVLTDLEFYELRYSGPSAAFLRGFRAIYLGLFFNCMIMATVTLAAAKIANVMLGWDPRTTVVICSLICIVFGSMSGLWGVLTTDLIQFVIAMIGVTAAAYYALDHPAVGGLAGMLEKIGQTNPKALQMIPDFTTPDGAPNWKDLMPLLIVPLAIQWWSTWYPGAEPGGGSYIAQRMLAARSEKDALAGTLWFNLAHYAVRPWPWIIVALCSLLVFPTLADIQRQLPHVSPDLIGHDLAYPAMLTLLPHGLLGLLVASLLAAYVSTMTTHMNWGTSYLVVDFYRRFVVGETGVAGSPRAGASPRRSESHYIWLSRAVSALLMILSGALMFCLTSAGAAFNLLLSVGAGTGSIYLLRWYWWRINAWSEIAAMVASVLMAGLTMWANRMLADGGDGGAAGRALAAWGWLARTDRGTWQIAEYVAITVAVGVTTVAWIVVTLLTPPTRREKLVEFYRLVRPAGPGWEAVRREAALPQSPDRLSAGLLASLLGCAFVYGALFGVGQLIYGNVLHACGLLSLSILCGAMIARLLSEMWRAAEAAGTR